MVGYVAPEVFVVVVLVGHGADEMQGNDHPDEVIFIESVRRHVIVAIVDRYGQGLIFFVILCIRE